MLLPIKLLRRIQGSLLMTLGKWPGPAIYASVEEQVLRNIYNSPDDGLTYIYRIALLIPGVSRFETHTHWTKAAVARRGGCTTTDKRRRVRKNTIRMVRWQRGELRGSVALSNGSRHHIISRSGCVAATDREVARRDSRFPSKRQETIGMIQSVHCSKIGHLGSTLSRITSVAFPHLVSHNPLWPHRLDIKETLQ